MSDNTTQPKVENEAGEDLKTSESQTDENANSNGANSGNVEKKEDNQESPYEKQLRELQEREKSLQEQIAKKDEIIQHKNRAIEKEKEKRKALESEDDNLDEEVEVNGEMLKKSTVEVLKALVKQELEPQLKSVDERFVETEIDSRIKSITSNQAERELIKKHYHKSIQKTGNLEIDIMNALAIANQHLVIDQKRKEAEEEQRESILTSFQSSSTRGSQNQKMLDPIKKQAASLLDKFDPGAKKYL